MTNFTYFQASGKQTANMMFLFTPYSKHSICEKKFKIPLCVKKLKYFVTKIMFDCFNFSQDISREKRLLLTAARQSSVQDPLLLLSIELSYKRREKHKNHPALIIYHGIITLWHLSPMLVYLPVNRFERKP